MKIRFGHIPVLALLFLVIPTLPAIVLAIDTSAAVPAHAGSPHPAPKAECNPAESGSTEVDPVCKASSKHVAALHAYIRTCITLAQAIWKAVQTVVVSLARVMVQSLIAVGLGLLRVLLPT